MVLTALKKDWWLLAINALLMAAYLLASSRTWIEPELRGDPDVARGGDAFVWFAFAVPFLGIAGLVDLIWLGFRARRVGLTEPWDFAPTLLFLIGGWLAIHAVNSYFIG